MPTVSVIIPVYNVERFIARCLDSVLDQTYTDWEAICVNDGSPDGSRAILAEYEARDTRIKVIDKEYGGPSDARNAGMACACGEYVVFLDSDDFIHPQTLEFSLALAQQNGSDLVTWYKEPYYRVGTIIKRKLGFDVDTKWPRSYYRRYKLEAMEQVTTDDVFAHFTERSHSSIKMPIKHLYVWRFLMRRTLIADLPFIKGIVFEDFPWTCELMLRAPRTTITQMPFYYYYPNVSSIVMATKRAHKITDWIKGLLYICARYEEQATDYQRAQWQRNCMWPVLEGCIARHLKDVQDETLRTTIAQQLQEVERQGILESAYNKKTKASRERIRTFIAQYALK